MTAFQRALLISTGIFFTTGLIACGGGGGGLGRYRNSLKGSVVCPRKAYDPVITKISKKNKAYVELTAAKLPVGEYQFLEASFHLKKAYFDTEKKQNRTVQFYILQTPPSVKKELAAEDEAQASEPNYEILCVQGLRPNMTYQAKFANLMWMQKNSDGGLELKSMNYEIGFQGSKLRIEGQESADKMVTNDPLQALQAREAYLFKVSGKDKDIYEIRSKVSGVELNGFELYQRVKFKRVNLTAVAPEPTPVPETPEVPVEPAPAQPEPVQPNL